jgi:hypothetical protein
VAARAALAKAAVAREATTVAIDQANEALARAFLMLELEDPDPEEPPPTAYPMPVVALMPGDAQIGVGITHPDVLPGEFTYMVVSWGGPTGYLGAHTHTRPFPTQDAITGLTNGTTYTVQVGYGAGSTPVPPLRLTRDTATPVGTTVVPPASGGLYPRTADIPTRRAWIMAKAGLADPGKLKVAGPGNVPSGCQWVPDEAGEWPSLYVYEATLLEDWDIPARIVPRAVPGNPPITLRNVRFYDAFTWEMGKGAGRIKMVERCHSTGPRPGLLAEMHRDGNMWGQANLNALAPGWVATGTILEGMSDAVQQSGGGLLEECVLRKLAVFGPPGSGSHNDFVQNYGGLVRFRRTLVEQDVTAGQDSHLNGVFCDGGDYEMEDSLVLVSAPAGSNTWALHAGKGNNRITLRHTAVRGKTVGNIVKGEGADVSSPY